MSGFVLVDDAVARDFEPFALTRPAGELRAGGALIRQRWAHALGMPCRGFISGAHLEAFREFDSPGVFAAGALPAGTILVNARCAPAWHAVSDASASAWTCGGRIAAIRLAAAMPTAALRSDGAALALAFAEHGGGETRTIDGWWLDNVWDLVGHLSAMLAADALAMMPVAATNAPPTMTVIGSHPVHVEDGARVEPLVVADASAGPILVRRGATIQSFTRLVGPCIVGEDVIVAGGRIAACSIGERSKVHGELNSTIFIGHANKGHDGFVGHSVIGRWANLGAGTITSNLKNSYGPVTLWTPSGVRGTGLTFLGSLLGDHVKTGIGTRLTTGCLVGAGANLFGTAMPPKYVPPFAWGENGRWDTFALERFLVVAERVMARRGVPLTDATRAQLSAAHAAALVAPPIVLPPA